MNSRLVIFLFFLFLAACSDPGARLPSLPGTASGPSVASDSTGTEDAGPTPATNAEIPTVVFHGDGG